MTTEILVIDGYPIIAALEESYIQKRTIWGNNCASVRARFKKKTSRTVKNGKEYESTNWYEEQCGGGLKSVGKVEPDYKKFYPPEPKPGITFKFQRYSNHVLLGVSDYDANLKIFKDCLVFKLDECVNRIHPLYCDPQRAIDSVRRENSLKDIIPGYSVEGLADKCQKFFSEETEEDPDEFENQ